MPLLKKTEGPEHFAIGPSKLELVIACPGSRNAPPSPPNPASTKGTYLHERAAEAIKGQPLPPDAQAVQPYVDYVVRHEGLGEILVEQKIQHPLIADFGGTCDALIVADKWLRVIDLKTGRRVVEAHNNKQLQAYAILAATVFPGRDTISAVIYQPPADEPVKETTFTQQQLDATEFDVLAASFSQELIAGPHCERCYCTARPTCPAYQAVYRKGAA